MLAVGGCHAAPPAGQRPPPSVAPVVSTVATTPGIRMSGAANSTFFRTDCIDTGNGGLRVVLVGRATKASVTFVIEQGVLSSITVSGAAIGNDLAARDSEEGQLTFADRTVQIDAMRVVDETDGRMVTLNGTAPCGQ
jgi:hypothetical protein